jgi:hypothetical protein
MQANYDLIYRDLSDPLLGNFVINFTEAKTFGAAIG